MSNITVIAGNISTGKWNVSTLFGAFSMAYGGDIIHLNNEVDNVELVTEDKVKKFGGSVGMGLLGAVALGPLGAIGGLLAGGNKKEVCFACQLKNGKKFLGKTDGKTYQKLMAISFNKT